MIRIRHLTLPAGLSAVVRRGADNNLEVFVSASLEPERARAAVRLALRAFRPGRRPAAGLLPLPLVLLLAAALRWLRTASRVLRAHAAAGAIVTAGLAVAAGAIFVVLPHQHAPASAGHGSAPALQAPASAPASATAAPQPGTSRGTQPRSGSGSTPAAGPPSQSARPSQAPPGSPAPSPSASGTQPASQPTATTSPAPSPTQSPGGNSGGGGCVEVLGIWLCL